jgi:hypothetical protein
MDFFEEMPQLDITLLTNNGNGGKPADATKTQTDNTQGVDTTTDIPTLEVDSTKDKGAQTQSRSIFESNEDEEPEVENTTTDNSTEESPVKVIASFLKEKGVAEFTDEEFRDDDEFIAETVNKTIEKKSTEGIQAYKDTLPEEIKALIENYEEGVPLGQLLEFEQKAFELSTITAEKLKEDSRLQEEIVEAHMLATGWNKEETNERIKELQDAGIMEKESIRSLAKLTQLEKANKENTIRQAQEKRKADAAKYQEQVAQLQKTITSKKEFFENLPTNDTEKKAVFEAITKYDKTGRNKISQLLADPEMYIKTAYFLEVLKGDLTKLKKAATTDVVKNTKKILDGTPVKTDSRFGSKDLSILKGFLKNKPKF